MKAIWNIGSVKHLAVALAAGILLTLGYSQGVRAEACGGADNTGTVAELLGTTCTIGDKTFTGFTFSGDLAATEVDFSTLSGIGGQWGFVFGFNLTVGANDTMDIRIGYFVSCSDGSACIDSIHAAMTGGVLGGGFATVSETYTPAGGLGTNFILTPASPTFDADFPPVTLLQVSKDINVFCGRTNPNADCFATISVVTNTVDQVTVPEPGTLALLAAGLLGLGWVGRRKQDRS